MDMQELETRARAYVERHFPRCDMRGQAIVTAEEAAELAAAACRMVAKRAEEIRFGEDIEADVRKEIGDVLFAAAALASLAGWNLAELVLERVEAVERRGPEGARS